MDAAFNIYKALAKGKSVQVATSAAWVMSARTASRLKHVHAIKNGVILASFKIIKWWTNSDNRIEFELEQIETKKVHSRLCTPRAWYFI